MECVNGFVKCKKVIKYASNSWFDQGRKGMKQTHDMYCNLILKIEIKVRTVKTISSILRFHSKSEGRANRKSGEFLQTLVASYTKIKEKARK